MRLIEWLLVLMTASICVVLSQPSFGQSSNSDELTEQDYKAAARYGYNNRFELRRLHNERKRLVNVQRIKDRVSSAMQADDKLEVAAMSDEALQGILRLMDGVLRAEGHDKLADDISTEYIAHYQFMFTNQLLGMKEIGDHPPANEWLATVHDRIHAALTDYWCQFFHLHLIMILNHGFPVVLNPSQYELPDYKDHFAGHMKSEWRFVHHGVAGGLTWILVQVACSGATSGMGMATFVCGPISSAAEFAMDKYLAPGMAERVWKKANE